ncbi:MAG TPA: tetratricopeptide repeat protein [Chitinophagaceae bacterium]|jgi:tetratricopeptide (TPR) repeat protein|nr:tetratricopeptide repeat protein [Chitinophagaceae bacterium]
MADKQNVQESKHDEIVIAKAKDFWSKYSKPIMIVSAVIIVAVGGFYIYKNFFKGPKEEKAREAIFKAEEYYRLDSVNLALNGDGQYDGFLKIISKYGGTDAANLAHFYAGDCYIKLNDNDKAIKQLKKFSTSSKAVQARAYKLTGDAYADLGQNADALNYYKKAARHFEKDISNSAEYLLYAAYLADRVMKDQKEAIALYKEIVEKFPNTQQSSDADKYLAQLGVYNVN